MRTSSRLVALLSGLLSLAPVIVLSGCSGGSSGDTSLRLNCGNGNSFCIVRCDLGCGSDTCSISEVAENQRIQFVFSQNIDRSSVDAASFGIRTSSGQAPDGDVLIQNNTLTFVPVIRVAGGLTSFGFNRNESYIVTLPGGPTAAQGIRSVSGDRLKAEFTCTIASTLGVIDEDALPPTATLVAPTELAAAPVDSTFEVRFSEVIDSSPFLVPTGATSPIRYILRRSQIDPNTGQRICDRTSSGIALEGLPRITLERIDGRAVTKISMKPSVNLPGLSCVEVQVTGDVRDLSGRNAVPVDFLLFTEAGQPIDIAIHEPFQNANNQDEITSGGAWSNGARPAQLGGDGHHGSFKPDLGGSSGSGIYEWNTDSVTIPGSNTFSGEAETVTNGRFFFTDFIVPENATIRFRGTRPAQIFVRGVVDIRGRIESNADSMNTFASRNLVPSVAIPGQPGGAGGAGGGSGGKGGDRCRGGGATIVAGVVLENGVSGQSVQLLAGHAYVAQSTGTGGAGSAMFPAHGVTAQLSLAPTTFTIQNIYNGAVSSGGGGGGFSLPGSVGNVPNPQPPIVPPSPALVLTRGPNTNAGLAFALMPFPPSPPPEYSSLNHFLVGGSGGGGGGSHPLYTIIGASTASWTAGAGGAGGGGAVAIRSGSNMSISTSAQFEAKGGNGALFNGNDPGTANQDLVSQPQNPFGVCSPGGGGSGGSFLLQSGSDLIMDGTINTAGGAGGRTGGMSPTNMTVISNAGGGSNGTFRVESNGTVRVSTAGHVPAYDPIVHRGALADLDDQVGSASKFSGTGLVFPPTWLRYELLVDDGTGTVTLYSDDPAVPGSAGPANDPTGPVQVFFQGAQLSPATNQIIPGSEGLWRPFVHGPAGSSINLDAATGFRFQLIFNRKDFANTVVRNLSVFARG